MDFMGLDCSRSDEGIENADGDPKRTPHCVYDCDERVSCFESVDPCDELRDAAKHAYLEAISTSGSHGVYVHTLKLRTDL